MTAAGASIDGPASRRFTPVDLPGALTYAALARAAVSPAMAKAVVHAPRGDCVCWGIPFRLRRPVLLAGDRPVEIPVTPFRAAWLVFQHTSDARPMTPDADGFYRRSSGVGRLGEHAADYVVLYADGAEVRIPIRRRHALGAFHREWGENSFEAVAHHKPYPLAPAFQQRLGEQRAGWGTALTRADAADLGQPWTNWLYAWENPRPSARIVGFRFEPVRGAVVLVGLSRGPAGAHPLRWEARAKAVLRLPRGTVFRPELDAIGRLAQVQLDMGQVISSCPRPRYPDADWTRTDNNTLPEHDPREVLIEYTAHPDAAFHLEGGRRVAVAAVRRAARGATLHPVAPAHRLVKLRVIDRASGRPVAVKLHAHGEAGEYLAPVDRHRIPNPAWFEDYSVDFAHRGTHWCTYIDGETALRLPLGRVFIEVSKGFEIRPVRTVRRVTRATRELTVAIDHVLPWRGRGWISADTHVHFLSPGSALIEGAGEGVNLVNLLASQWGELMTNVGDFDGRTTHGARAAGGDGEYLVRVGTENRQHVLGHISLLGYRGPIIAPMTTGGPDEAALGDPIDVLLTEWARQCRRQGGLVVIPHFPNPRAEHAATIVEGAADAVEMTSWGNLYSGIDPYSLSDWYRYLNCGYALAAVGGTDKMSATTPVGAVRTYARLAPGRPYTHAEWLRAVKRAETFVTYGPLMEFTVEGRPMGARLTLPPGGGTVEVAWETASVTVPMTSVELVVNGEIREGAAVGPEAGRGRWSVRLARSSWLALLVRGHYPGRAEIIAAHSSPVMARVGATPFFAAADALTILEQIEGAQAYLNTVGTRAQTAAFKRMRAVLAGAHRRLHNRLHHAGIGHRHTPADHHTGPGHVGGH